jgi:hypothetical protein
VTGLVAAGAPAATVQQISLGDNSTTRLLINASARDNNGNWFAVESYTRWTRTAGGDAEQLGIDSGPQQANNIPNFVGLSLVGSGNDVQVVYEGSSSAPSRYEILIWVVEVPLASA